MLSICSPPIMLWVAKYAKDLKSTTKNVRNTKFACPVWYLLIRYDMILPEYVFYMILGEFYDMITIYVIKLCI